jgi:hypothetical protein
VISILVSLACACLIAFTHAAWGGERLVYAIVYKGSDYAAIKTEIFSVDPETSDKRPVFSDEKTSIVLLQNLYVFHFPVAGREKLFAHATERGKSVSFPGNDSLYELFTDGSNHFRKICPVLGAESLGDIFMNSTGTRIGYINRMKRKEYLFIHDTVTGRLLYQVDITDKFLDCYAASIGWIPRSGSLYFSLQTGDDHVTSKSSYAKVGSYFMDERGRHLERLPALPAAKGFFPAEETRIIGVLPTGECIFETMESTKRPSPHIAVWKVTRDFSDSEDISFGPAAGLYSGIRVIYKLSSSGEYLSAARLPISSSAVSWDIWLKNLHTRKERNILSFPAGGLQGPFLGLVGWLH